MGIEEVKIAPRSPWQNPYAERMIGTLRREPLDRVVVFNAGHLVGTPLGHTRMPAQTVSKGDGTFVNDTCC